MVVESNSDFRISGLLKVNEQQRKWVKTRCEGEFKTRLWCGYANTSRAQIGEITSPPRYITYTRETYCKKHKYSCGELGAINVSCGFELLQFNNM